MQMKSLKQVIEEAVIKVAVDIDGKKMIDIAVLSEVLKDIKMMESFRIPVKSEEDVKSLKKVSVSKASADILPEGPPDTGKK